MTFEERLADLRSSTFPMTLPGGLTAYSVDHASFTAGIKPIWGRVFPNRPPLYDVPPERKTRTDELRGHYRGIHHEHILGRDSQGQVVGWFCGEMEDFESFYLRNAGLVPELRKRGLLKTFAPRLLAYLRELGYERVTAQHHTNNRAVLIGLLKAGFNIEGMNLHERWGVLVKTVHFLQAGRQREFEKVFHMLEWPD